MTFDKRRQTILSAVEVQETVKVGILAKQLDVTEMTIRRDLNRLEHEGVIKRVHGGGISLNSFSYEPTLNLRNTVHIEEKRRIARVAAELIADDDFIALDVGSSTYELARVLVTKRRLTVITPSFLIATILVNRPNINLILPGGIVRPGETSMIGDLSQRAMEKFNVDRLFLGVGGIDAGTGLTDYSWDDTLVKQVMLKNAKQVIALADASKFNRIATVKIAPLDVLNILVSDQPPDLPLADAFEMANVKVHVAD